MTIASSERSIRYTPTVLTDTFVVPFPLFETDELWVWIDGVRNTSFAVTGANVDGRIDNPVVTLPVEIINQTIVISGERPVRSDADPETVGQNVVDELFAEIDKLAVMQQEMARNLNMAVRVPGHSALRDIRLPDPEPGKLVIGNSAGTGFEYLASLPGSVDLSTFVNDARDEADRAEAAAAVLTGNTALSTVVVTGAVGDGVADDYLPIYNACVAAGLIKGTVVFPAGIYRINFPIHIPNGIKLDMTRGAKIVRSYDFAQPPGYDHTHATIFTPEDGLKFQDISFLGGVLDMNGQNFEFNAVCIGAQQWENVSLDGVEILNVPSFHALDIADADGVRIRDCSFKGFADLSVGAVRGFSEAIQIDPGYTPGPGAAVRRLLVENCYFGDNPDNADVRFGPWPCGVGNHASNNPDSIAENVQIRGNTFDGMTLAGIRLFAADDVTVSENQFLACADGVRLSQGTGTKNAGCRRVSIAMNVFKDCIQDDIGIEANNTTDPAASLHQDISIIGNNHLGSDAIVRAERVHGLTVHGNNANGFRLFLTALEDVQRVSMVGNTGRAATDTVVYISGASRDWTISGNMFFNMAGRFLHCTGVTNAASRGRLAITGNVLTDCSGPVFIAIDSGASADVLVAQNSFLVETPGSVPSTDEIVRSTVTGRVEVIDNYVSDELDGKVMRVEGGGIFRGRIMANPEGLITCGVGSTAYRPNGAAGFQQYVKETGTGNTGWKRVTGLAA